MKKLCLLLTGLLLLGGCHCAFAQRETQKINENYWYNSTAARNLEPSHEILVTPLLADVEVQVKGPEGRRTFDEIYYVDADYTRESKDRFITELKKQALFDFSNRYNADVIIGALISTQTIDDDKDGLVDREGSRYKVRITIIGYPANYVNFRNAKESDRWVKELLLNVKRDEDRNAAVTGAQSSTVSAGRKTTVVAR